jgi:hypothetical protein
LVALRRGLLRRRREEEDWLILYRQSVFLSRAVRIVSASCPPRSLIFQSDFFASCSEVLSFCQ